LKRLRRAIHTVPAPRVPLGTVKLRAPILQPPTVRDHKRLGRFVRLMPHAVVGGYSAGTGLLIFTGAFRIVTGRPISLDQLSSFVHASVLIRWLPGVVLAVILLLVVARVRHVVAVPVVLVAALVVFYAAAWATGTSLETARSQGWLLSAPSGGQWYAPLTPASLPHIHWAALSTASATLAAFPVIAALAVLLSMTGARSPRDKTATWITSSW
jgi:sulfate permease, SulP family